MAGDPEAKARKSVGRAQADFEVEASEVRRTVSANIQPKLGENFGNTAEIVAVRSH